jgi:hypothetical protein
MLHIFPVQIRSVARVDSLKSASRDQVVNPESHAGSLLFVERRNRFLQRLIVRMLRFVKNPRRGCAFDNAPGIRHQDATARIGTMPRSCVRSKRWRDEWARVRISSVDILPPGFRDANVATEHDQSNRRDRCRQGKDKPHRPGMPRTVCGTKRR